MSLRGAGGSTSKRIAIHQQKDESDLAHDRSTRSPEDDVTFGIIKHLPPPN